MKDMKCVIIFFWIPWPEPTERQQQAIEAAAQGVLDARMLARGLMSR